VGEMPKPWIEGDKFRRDRGGNANNLAGRPTRCSGCGRPARASKTARRRRQEARCRWREPLPATRNQGLEACGSPGGAEEVGARDHEKDLASRRGIPAYRQFRAALRWRTELGAVMTPGVPGFGNALCRWGRLVDTHDWRYEARHWR